MEVKKFRAATTREALEQIKSILGENAFVLETKQVQTRGFLGLGAAKTEIEVSAAAPPAPSAPARAAKTKNNGAARRGILNLTDDEPAAPRFLRTNSTAPLPPLESALAAVAGKVPAVAENAEQTEASRGIEISSEAPRIVFERKDAVATATATTNAIAVAPKIGDALVATNVPAPATPLHGELERLRAELREMKFSLGAFAARQSAYSSPKDFAFDAPAELYDSPYYEAYLELTATGLQAETARDIICAIIPLYDTRVDAAELARSCLQQALPRYVHFERDPLSREGQTILAAVGATGVGKTTTLAKLAARAALRERRRVELVTLDTYRIAAVEQLKTYAEIIGAGMTVVRSILELDATLSRMPEDAVILLDTTGRSPHDLADQLELSDYLRSREDIFKCLMLQATTHPIDAALAVKKYELYGANCLALTKLDETTRPGAAVNVAADSLLPLVYLCAGQRVPEDLETASSETLTARVFNLQAQTA